MSAIWERHAAMSVGVIGLGLVLGWSALFSRGSSWLSRLSWLTMLSALIVVAPDTFIAAGAVAFGACTHLMMQLGLEGRRG